jgi:PKD repeat protein
MKKKMKIILLIISILFTVEISTAQINTFPYTEDFESFTTCGTACGNACLLNPTASWLNDLSDNLDWLVDNGGTSSSNTGPSIDHNPGTSVGNYLYIESSCGGTGFPNMTANILSPAIDLTGTNDIQFEFWYHMFGTSMGTMHVDISVDGGTTWTNDIIPSWTDNADLWQLQTVSLGAYVGQTAIVRIRHITGTNFFSDAAIDDVKIYDLLQNDAGISAFLTPTLPECTFNNDSIIVELTNYGTDTLTSVNIDWLLNTTSGSQVNWTGSIAPGGSESVYLGTVAYVDGDSLSAQTSLPNGIAELQSGTGNDQALISVKTGLAGNYTIGATGVYSTFNAAIIDLNTFGVCGPVVFEIEDGVYSEQIILTEVIGMNATNTVTFQGLNADPALATLEFQGTGAADNYVVYMDGGDNYHFNNLTLSSTGLAFGTVIHIQNGATNNSWMNNLIKGDANVSTTSANMALVYSPSGSSLDSMNLFDNNVFENGSYVMYSYGENDVGLENGTSITNNTMTGFFFRGLHMYYQNNMQISGNTLTPGTSYTGPIYRLYLIYADGDLSVDNNRINGMNSGYGIYMSNCDALNTNRAYVYNNFIHVGDTANTNTSYGLYLTACNNQVATFNSINIESNGPTSRAIYISGGNQNYILNNIFSNSGPGYGMYYLSGVTSSDNNNIYVPNGIPFYFGADIADINTWQGLTSFDSASDTLNPLFATQEDLHSCQSSSIDGGALPDTIVMYDIDGQIRDLNTPDIGADEFLGLDNLTFASDTILKCGWEALTIGGWEPVDDAISYLWNNTESTPTINVTSEGDYSVLITTACGSANPSVVVMNIPDAIAGFTTISSFMTVALTNTSTGTIDSYLWDFGDGNTSTDLNPTHLYADTGAYDVTLTVTGPCGTDVITESIWSNTIGVEELAIFQSLDVYPNPNNGNFTVELNTEEGTQVSLQLTDIKGIRIWDSNAGIVNGSYSENIEILNQTEGMYFLSVTIGENTAVRKLIIK